MMFVKSRRTINPVNRLFQLFNLFFGGQGGGLYSPLTAFQDVNAATPAVAAGNTIGRINDVHTATETFATFYTSDFSAGLDSWTGTQGTAAGNIDSILGRNDCLRLTVLGVGGATYLERTSAFFGTTRNRTVISVYVPAAQTYVDGFRVYAGDNSTGTLIYDGASSNGAWVDVDVTKYISSTTIRVYAYIGTSATINALGVGSLMYVRGMVSSYTNLLNFYQSTASAKPSLALSASGHLMPNYGGDDYLRTGITSFGSGCTLFATSTQRWSFGLVWQTTVGGTLVNKASGANATKTIQIRITSATNLRIFVRGSSLGQSDVTGNYGDGNVRCAVVNWDRTTLTWVDNSGVTVLSVGTAADEGLELCFGANDLSSPNIFFSGLAQLEFITDTSLSPATIQAALGSMRSRWGAI